ncbi:MAG: hypothetical protein SF162_19560 [bacterium]|nr:hypothetical protein [bacterium]
MPPTKRSRTDLLSLIAAYQREQKRAPLREAQKRLAAALDAVNALGALDDARRVRFSPALCHGAAARLGLTPQPWVGAMIWHRPPGYLGYKTLTLMGVWAVAPDPEGQTEAVEMRVGVKRLPFAAPFYDPESYFKLIRTQFDLYYQDDGAPPAASTLIVRYDADQRLALRETIRQAVFALA